MYIFSRWLWSSMIQKSSKISFWAFTIVMHYTIVMITYHKVAWNYYLAMLWYLYAYHVAHFNESYICHTCKKVKMYLKVGKEWFVVCFFIVSSWCELLHVWKKSDTSNFSPFQKGYLQKLDKKSKVLKVKHKSKKM